MVIEDEVANALNEGEGAFFGFNAVAVETRPVLAGEGVGDFYPIVPSGDDVFPASVETQSTGVKGLWLDGINGVELVGVWGLLPYDLPVLIHDVGIHQLLVDVKVRAGNAREVGLGD